MFYSTCSNQNNTWRSKGHSHLRDTTKKPLLCSERRTNFNTTHASALRQSECRRQMLEKLVEDWEREKRKTTSQSDPKGPMCSWSTVWAFDTFNHEGRETQRGGGGGGRRRERDPTFGEKISFQQWTAAGSIRRCGCLKSYFCRVVPQVFSNNPIPSTPPQAPPCSALVHSQPTMSAHSPQ